VPTTVDNVIRELEDEGEVIKPQTIQFLWMFDFFWLVSGDIMGNILILIGSKDAKLSISVCLANYCWMVSWKDFS
jgi:hypothetical protein